MAATSIDAKMVPFLLHFQRISVELENNSYQTYTTSRPRPPQNSPILKVHCSLYQSAPPPPATTTTMPSESSTSPRWREKATGFFSTSGVRIKQAGSFVGEATKDARGNVAGAAERVGTAVRSRWDVIRQSRQQQQQRHVPPPGETVQERILSAAASTGLLLKKGISETKEKVEEAAKKTADKSKGILNNIERWQKGVSSNDVIIPVGCQYMALTVFGVPIELAVQRQHTIRPVPQILVICADNLIISGLHDEYLFKSEGDKKVIRQLISLYNQDWNSSLPDGVSPLDVAALMKCYLASLPEPLTTFALYHEIRGARSSINDMINILKKLPNVNYMTLEFVTALLLRVSQRSSLNKMDAHSLAMELAPLIIWDKGNSRADFCGHLYYTSRGPSKTVGLASNNDAWDNYLEDDDSVDVSAQVPLDDGLPPDYNAIEVIQCLIEHHNAIFTDANETVWR